MANTPNIDLVKPAGTDHALVSVLNANSDKIDTFAGTTNAAIANYITATGVSKSISTGSMDDVKTPGRYFYTNQLTNRPSTTDGYLDVYALNANYIKQVAHESITYKMYVRYCNNGTWSNWQELALKSDTPVRHSKQITTNSDGIAVVDDYTFDSTISVNVESTTNYFVELRKSAAGNLAVFAFDSSLNKLASTTIALSIWTKG